MQDAGVPIYGATMTPRVRACVPLPPPSRLAMRRLFRCRSTSLSLLTFGDAHEHGVRVRLFVGAVDEAVRMPAKSGGTVAERVVAAAQERKEGRARVRVVLVLMPHARWSACMTYAFLMVVASAAESTSSRS